MSETMAFRLSKVTRIVSFEDGETIWAKGKPAEAWCHIVKGCVGITTNSKKDTFEPLGVFSENSWFGEQHIISNTVTHADYVCLSETELLMIPKAHVSDCLEQDVGFSIYLARLMAWRIQKTSESLMLMKSENRGMRVVMGLYSISELISRGFNQPQLSGRDVKVKIPFTQSLLASFCGVSRTIFSQHVRKLFNAGLLNLSYGSIEIKDLDKWEQFAELQKLRNDTHAIMSIEDMLLEFDREAESAVFAEQRNGEKFTASRRT
jgi:CRP-like cAMP-binding protein